MRCEDIDRNATGFAERTQRMKREVKRHFWYHENPKKDEHCQCCGMPLEEPYAVLDRETGKRHSILKGDAANLGKARSGAIEGNDRFILVRQFYCPSLLDRWQGFDNGRGGTELRSPIDQAYIEIAQEKREALGSFRASASKGGGRL